MVSPGNVQHFHYISALLSTIICANGVDSMRKRLTYLIMTLQFLLMVVFVLMLAFTPSRQLFVRDRLVGAGLLLVGILVMAAAVYAYQETIGTLRIKATPEPSNRGGLITSGVYSYIRHPFYTAAPTIIIGFALLVHRPWGLALIPLVLGLLYWKSTYEERLLEARFPEYAAYRARTGRFFPAIARNIRRSQ
jgi:protein-S-isoprenylcysteine O-methyltransferase Ste14